MLVVLVSLLIFEQGLGGPGHVVQRGARCSDLKAFRLMVERRFEFVVDACWASFMFKFTAQRTAQVLSKSLQTRKMSTITPLLLPPRQVADLIKSSTPVTVLDSTWFMPNSPRNAKAEYLSKRIPGSQFLDLDEVANPHELGLKHMMPDSKTFALACGMCVVDTCSH